MDQLLKRIPAAVDAIAEARDGVRSWLASIGADDEVAEELLVVASELCAHMIARRPTEDITLRAWVDETAVSIEVTAPTSEVVPITSAGTGDDPLASGRPGRLVVERLCDRLEVTDSGQLRSIRCIRGRWKAPRRPDIRRLDR